MADTVFACPACNQSISCDSAYAGQQLQCPVCHQTITMPKPGGGGGSFDKNNPLVPKPPAEGRLSLNQNAQQPATTGQRNIPIRNLAGPAKKKEGPWKTIAEVVAIVAVLGIGGYFGYPYVKAKFKPADQQETAAATPAATPAPAPAEQTTTPSEQPPQAGTPAAPPAEAAPTPTPDGSTPVVKNAVQTGKVIPPTYNLEIAAAKTPSGRVNGKISNGDFLPEIVRIDPSGASQVLRFVQGEPLSPDREVLVYLRFKTGEKIQNQTITVSSDQRTKGLPQVIKRWKTNPRYAPTSRSFSSGYAMRLEFGALKNGVVQGKIYLSFPDTENSVIGGSFAASTSIPAEGISAPTLPAPGQAPAPTAMPNQMPSEYGNRYTR